MSIESELIELHCQIKTNIENEILKYGSCEILIRMFDRLNKLSGPIDSQENITELKNIAVDLKNFIQFSRDIQRMNNGIKSTKMKGIAECIEGSDNQSGKVIVTTNTHDEELSNNDFFNTRVSSGQSIDESEENTAVQKLHTVVAEHELVASEAKKLVTRLKMVSDYYGKDTPSIQILIKRAEKSMSPRFSNTDIIKNIRDTHDVISVFLVGKVSIVDAIRVIDEACEYSLRSDNLELLKEYVKMDMTFTYEQIPGKIISELTSVVEGELSGLKADLVSLEALINAARVRTKMEAIKTWVAESRRVTPRIIGYHCIK